jgi:8-oxo-dGTP diphosphatase
VAGVARRGEEILLTQRPPAGEHGLMWEFPGGKIEPGESPQAALAREIREELGVDCAPRRVLGEQRHEYPSGLQVEIVFIECELGSVEFEASDAVHAVRWVHPGEVDPRELLAADRSFLAGLAAARRPDP